MLGIARDLSEEPHAVVLFLDKPIIVEERGRDRLDLELFGFDPTLAPSGKSVMKVVMESSYDYWKNLSADSKKYYPEKQKVAESVIMSLEKRFPGLKDQTEAVDVVTPVSAERFTGSFHGYQTWGAPKEYEREIKPKGLSETFPGLENFYMTGQWAGATIGLNTVALMNRNLVRDLCKNDEKKFVTVMANHK